MFCYSVEIPMPTNFWVSWMQNFRSFTSLRRVTEQRKITKITQNIYYSRYYIFLLPVKYFQIHLEPVFIVKTRTLNLVSFFDYL